MRVGKKKRKKESKERMSNKVCEGRAGLVWALLFFFCDCALLFLVVFKFAQLQQSDAWQLSDMASVYNSPVVRAQGATVLQVTVTATRCAIAACLTLLYHERHMKAAAVVRSIGSLCVMLSFASLMILLKSKLKQAFDNSIYEISNSFMQAIDGAVVLFVVACVVGILGFALNILPLTAVRVAQTLVFLLAIATYCAISRVFVSRLSAILSSRPMTPGAHHLQGSEGETPMTPIPELNFARDNMVSAAAVEVNAAPQLHGVRTATRSPSFRSTSDTYHDLLTVASKMSVLCVSLVILSVTVCAAAILNVAARADSACGLMLYTLNTALSAALSLLSYCTSAGMRDDYYRVCGKCDRMVVGRLEAKIIASNMKKIDT